MDTVFEEMMVEKVTERVGEECEIRIRKVGKNNGVSRTAIESVKGDDNMGTLVYLDDFFREGLSEEEVDMMADEIATACKSEKLVDPASVVKSVMNWEYAKKHLVMRIVNAGWNAENLQGIPHRDFLDLAIVYHVMISDFDSSSTMTSPVNGNMIFEWGVSENELYEAAMENMKKNLPETFQSMASILGFKEDPDMGSPLYVLSNSGGVYGATALLYGEALKKMAERTGSDIYILPSSIHEVLLLPANHETVCEKDLLDMVWTINRTQVERQDWLSDNIYRYCRASGHISVISQAEAA